MNQEQGNNKKSLLVIPDKRIDLDLIAATISLSETYRDENYKVSILVDESNYPKFIENIFPRRGIEKFDPGRSNEYILTLNKDNANIKKVDWKQDQDKIQLIISTEDGKLQAGQTKVEKATGEFDKVVMLGSKEPNDLGEFYNNNNDLFDENKLIKIKYNKNIEKKVSPSMQNSISEKVYEFLKGEGLKISKFTATNLLSGIYWKTSGFTENIKNTNVFKIVSELIDLDASLDIAIKKSFQNLKTSELSLISKIFGNFKVDDNNIGISVVSKNEISEVKLNHLIFRYWDIIKYTYKAKVAMVLLEQEKVYGYVFSNIKRVSAYDVVEEFGGTGDEGKAIIESASDIKTVEDKLYAKAEMILTGKQKKKENKEQQRIQNEVKIDKIPSQEKKQEQQKYQPSEKEANKREEDLDTNQSKTQKDTPNINEPTEEKPDFSGADSYIPSIDPLSPATEMPQPLNLNKEKEKPKKPAFKSPLPPAEDS